MLFISAVVSLVLGLFHQAEQTDWVEGATIMVAVVIIVIAESTNDWRKEYQTQQLNDKREKHSVHVIRDGVACFIDLQEVVVGDIVLLTPGEVVPCPGVFLSGNVRCHETDSRKMHKKNYEDVKSYVKNGRLPVNTDCFVFPGSQVLEGVGSYVVIAVGTKSFHGRASQSEPETSPLRQKLNALAEMIAKLSLAVGFVLFCVLIVRFLVKIRRSKPVLPAIVKGIDFVNILIIVITLIVVAVPRGLLLDVTFATRQMTDEKLLVRSFRAFESMEDVSVFCTAKTGVLTQNEVTVVAGSIGDHAKFKHANSCQDLTQYNLHEDSESSVNSLQGVSGQQTDPNRFSVSRDELVFVLSLALLNLLKEAIELNSGALKDQKTGELVCAEDQTEAALLHFAEGLDCGKSTAKRDTVQMIQTVPFSSRHKGRCVVVRLPNGTYRAYFRGASEDLLRKSTRHVVVPLPASQRGLEEHDEVVTRPIGTSEELFNQPISSFNKTISSYAQKGFRTIALCYKDLEEWSPPDVMCEEEKVVQYSDLAQDLTLIAIIAVEDKLREGVKDMVKRCHDAGLNVKMVTGDNLHTACSLALQSGLSSNNVCSMEGSNFRKRTKQEQHDNAQGLEVLARASPEDKKVFIQTLEKFGRVVCVTANRSALKTAEVDFSMTITGTEVTKESSHVTVMDDNFTSILKVITWSRCFNDAVRKLLQFQIPTIVAVVVTTVVSTVASNNASSVLSGVQLLWIHLIMDPFAALALLTDRPPETFHPYRKTRPLFTTDMYNQILI
ncbi:hypothetical protein C0992_007449 [Termitomyces sp. T32_za158]|nr:hypothetical protein C0992_007449 [Termitomyces sp. T32_za158]